MDIRAQITNTIISMLEQGSTDKWERPWKSVAAKGLPRNYTTGRAYTGVNVLLLWCAAQERGYGRNEWMTYNQAQQIGAKVRAGAKGVMGIFYKMVERKKGDAGDGEDDAKQGGMMPMLKPFWVFNVAEIEGLPAQEAPMNTAFNPAEEGEFILAASGADIRHGGNRAYYSPGLDFIQLPEKAQFANEADYYATGFHELIHWTGNAGRLGREYGKKFGDDAYAFEELVAELGASFLMADLGMHEATIQGHANYVDHWLKVLKADKGAIFTAAKAASAAHALIVSQTGQEGDEAGA